MNVRPHALEFTQQNNMVFIPPFDHLKVIEGQGTVGKEILDELSNIDYIFVPIGGGGLMRRRWTIFQNILTHKQKSLVLNRWVLLQ